MSAPRAPAVALEGVGKRFGDGTTAVDALTEIALTVAAGEFVSLIGPSGCGKSTLLRIIANLIDPTEGSVSVNGKSARRARLDQDYGIAFQQAGLLEWRTVQANVELPLALHGVAREERRKQARELLELVGLSEFGALDEMTRERMQSELIRICAETRAAVVFVTHSIPEAVFLSQRAVVMSPRPGRITDIIDVPPGTRDEDFREADPFYATITEVREALRGRTREGSP